MGLLLLALLGVIAVSAASAPKGPKAPPPEEPLLYWRGDRLAYQRAVALMLIRSLSHQVATPTDQQFLTLLYQAGRPVGPQEWGAWFALADLHAAGFDVWVPADFHVAAEAGQPRPAMYLPPGTPGNAPELAGMALLITADESWPPMPADLQAAAA